MQPLQIIRSNHQMRKSLTLIFHSHPRPHCYTAFDGAYNLHFEGRGSARSNPQHLETRWDVSTHIIRFFSFIRRWFWCSRRKSSCIIQCFWHYIALCVNSRPSTASALSWRLTFLCRARCGYKTDWYVTVMFACSQVHLILDFQRESPLQKRSNRPNKHYQSFQRHAIMFKTHERSSSCIKCPHCIIRARDVRDEMHPWMKTIIFCFHKHPFLISFCCSSFFF